MRPLSILLTAPLVSLVALASLGLGSCDSPTCADYATCGAGADAGVVTPSGCDLTKGPKDSPACVDDAVGVFVDATGGADTNPGTRAAPKKTVGAAVAAANGKPRVYVCQGTYGESVAIKTPVSLYGGLSCGAFAYTGAKPTIQPSAGTDYALDVSASGVTVSDLALLGPEMGAPNSIAVRVVGATGVTFIGARLEGRTGAKGADGTLTGFTGFPTQADLNGADATAGAPGGSRTATCPGGRTSVGGKGGESGVNGDPGLPPLGGGAGGTITECQGSNAGGKPGGSAGSALNGDGAKVLGSLAQSAWSPESGDQGSNGDPGQGGGGGAGVGGIGNNGGGGGAGGCGGAGGGGALGGGASVALLSITSDPTIHACTLQTAAAGDGGKGAGGQLAQTQFGLGGTRTGSGCNGGNGGKGGTGGAGGGGAGGISVGYLFQGPKPSLDPDVTVTHGTAGKKGIGGTSGTNDGVDGVAQDSYEAP
jgi:hypothetical protein